ncbi:MAG: HAD family hydrolase [Zavarzinella sp.]
MKVLLFDIDGTLIRSGGAGKWAMEAALKTAFQVPEIRDSISFAGRTDPGIIAELLEIHELPVTAENLERMHQEYLSHLPRALKTHRGEVLPGITEIFARPTENTLFGLLTGNIRQGAEMKLRYFGLWDHFQFGGFADNLANRDDVARRAMVDLHHHLQFPIAGDQVWVIGDTPADVQCARAIGAKAVAVSTGWHTPEQLKACQPDYLVENFTAAHEVLHAWGMA